MIQCLTPSAVTSLGSPAKRNSRFATGRSQCLDQRVTKVGRDGSHPSRLLFFGYVQRDWICRPLPAVAARADLLNRIDLIARRANQADVLTPPVQPPLQKYSASRLTQISSLSRAVPCPNEGRFAIVTDVGRGMRWTRLRLKTKGAFADGEVVWS